MAGTQALLQYGTSRLVEFLSNLEQGLDELLIILI